MKDFEVINKDTNEKFIGQFDDKGSKENPYVIFNHNGMIGILNPSGIPSKELNKILMDNCDSNNLNIDYNNYVIKIK